MLSVLFVSANADYREIYTTGLQHCGLRVVWAEGRPDSIECVRGYPIDVITFHLESNDQEQWRVCRSIAALIPRTPLILLANWMHMGGRSAKRAFSFGCAAFVIEPCTPHDLAGIVEEVVSGDR